VDATGFYQPGHAFSLGAPQLFPLDSTSPSVAGGSFFLTHSTSPGTTITSFTGQSDGQIIIVACPPGDTTTIANGAAIHLTGGNYVCPNSPPLELVYTSSGVGSFAQGGWFEIGRQIAG
jgi:hypothetical protein